MLVKARTIGFDLRQKLIEDWSGKKVTVMGLGQYRWGSGWSAAWFFADLGARVTVTDQKPVSELRAGIRALRKYKIRFVLGCHEITDFIRSDLIVRNPVVPDSNRFIRMAKERNIPITSDVALFVKYCPAPIIGVTGTRGKSTTATLLAEILRQRWPSAQLGGNIGLSPLRFLYRCRPGTPVVLELSSWMLETMVREPWRPKISIITNIYKDHMNHHGTLSSYVKAKALITRWQKNDDYLVYNQTDDRVKHIARKSKAIKIPFSTINGLKTGCWITGTRIKCSLTDASAEIIIKRPDRLPGIHNTENILAAVTAARILGLSQKQIQSGVDNFRGVPERQEVIAVKRGLTFVDDTTSTMPDATIAALRTFTGRIALIAGGTDKQLDFTELIPIIRKKVAILILLPGSATDKIIKLLRRSRNSRYVGPVRSMQEAVTEAIKRSTRGTTIILSPGAASFGLFTNEFDRGRAFKRAVERSMK